MYEAMSALKGVAGSSVNHSSSQPRCIIESGFFTTFVTSTLDLTNPKPHKATLRKAAGSNSSTTHERKFMIPSGNEPIVLPALFAPQSDENLILVG